MILSMNGASAVAPIAIAAVIHGVVGCAKLSSRWSTAGLSLSPSLSILKDTTTTSFVIGAAMRVLIALLLGTGRRAAPLLAATAAFEHFEAAAWATFLTSSLVLGFWSAGTPDNIGDERKHNRNLTRSYVQRASWIAPLVPFVLGCVGTCAATFLVAFLMGSAGLPSAATHDMSIASCALLASFIGGSVNFLETATALSLRRDLVRQIAALDIGVMIAFFNVLKWIRLNPRIQSMLSGHAKRGDIETNPSKRIESEPYIQTDRRAQPSVWTAAAAIGASVGLSRSACWVQGLVGIPGTSVITAALVALAIRPFLFVTGTTPVALERNRGRQTLFASLSDYFMCLFYATIGLGFEMSNISIQSGYIIAAISVMLGVHLASIVLGSLAWNHWVAREESPYAEHVVELDTAIIASEFYP
jgi:Protein of unknown function (DUF819)